MAATRRSPTNASSAGDGALIALTLALFALAAAWGFGELVRSL